MKEQKEKTVSPENSPFPEDHASFDNDTKEETDTIASWHSEKEDEEYQQISNLEKTRVAILQQYIEEKLRKEMTEKKKSSSRKKVESPKSVSEVDSESEEEKMKYTLKKRKKDVTPPTSDSEEELRTPKHRTKAPPKKIMLDEYKKSKRKEKKRVDGEKLIFV